MAEDIKNMNLSISVDDGFRRVPITNQYGEEIGVFYFNPTDIGIIGRYNHMAETFDKITEPLNNLPEFDEDDSDATDEARFAALEEAKKRLYDAVDELFDGNAAEAFFGKTHPFSPVDGDFYCSVVLQTVGRFIGEQFNTETKKMSARVEKYTNRAQRRAKK